MAREEGDEKPARPAASIDFGNRLRQRAQELGLTNAEVARRLKIDNKRYSNYVNGVRQPDLETLHRISAVLGITVDELISPGWPLLESDRDTYLATKALGEYLLDLTAAETRVLAELALFLRSERRSRAATSIALPHQMHKVARVHEQLIPSIIGTLKPRRISTDTDFGNRGDMYLSIHIDFPLGQDEQELDRALRGLARERLRGTPFEVTEITHRRLPRDLQTRLVLKFVDASSR